MNPSTVVFLYRVVVRKGLYAVLCYPELTVARKHHQRECQGHLSLRSGLRKRHPIAPRAPNPRSHTIIAQEEMPGALLSGTAELSRSGGDKSDTTKYWIRIYRPAGI